MTYWQSGALCVCVWGGGGGVAVSSQVESPQDNVYNVYFMYVCILNIVVYPVNTVENQVKELTWLVQDCQTPSTMQKRWK